MTISSWLAGWVLCVAFATLYACSILDSLHLRRIERKLDELLRRR